MTVALVIADNIRDTTISTGLTLTLAGASITNYKTVRSALRPDGAEIAANDLILLTIKNQSANEWETGIFTYSTTGSPDVVQVALAALLESSTGSTINFSAGTKDVFSAPAAKLFLTGGIATAVGDVNYSILVSDGFVYTNTTISTPRTWTLPAASGYSPGRRLVISDMAGGVSSTNSIIVAASGADTIMGLTSLTINSQYSAVVLESNGISKWVSVGTTVNSGTREKLTATRNYYVRTDGSDTNTGLANTAGAAFLTIQKAINVASDTLDLGNYNVIINVAAGTYTGAITAKNYVAGNGIIEILGDIATPSNVVISVTANICFYMDAVLNTYWVRGVKFVSTSSGQHVYCQWGKTLWLSEVEFGACATGYEHVTAFGTGQAVRFVGAYTISGGARVHWLAYAGGAIECAGRTVTITGTPAFAGQFCECDSNGLCYVNANTFVGSATGVKYTVRNMGLIYVAGAATSYLPGNASGAGTNPGASPWGLYF